MNATVLSLAVYCLCAAEIDTSQTPTTHLYVRTTPSGAKVFLDGNQLGTSPGLFPVKAGVRRIIIELEGHEQEAEDVTIRVGRVKRINLVLKERPDPAKERPDSVAEVLKQFQTAANELDGDKLAALFLPPDDTPAGQTRRKHLEEAAKDWPRMKSQGTKMELEFEAINQRQFGKDAIVSGLMVIRMDDGKEHAEQGRVEFMFRITPTSSGWKIAEMNTTERPLRKKPVETPGIGKTEPPETRGRTGEEDEEAVGEVISKFAAAVNALDHGKLAALFLPPDDTPAGKARQKHLDEAAKDWPRMKTDGVKLELRFERIEPRPDGKDILITATMSLRPIAGHSRPVNRPDRETVEFRITPTPGGWKIAEMNVAGRPAQEDRPAARLAVQWTCSMHPQIRTTKEGQCPICAMSLVPRPSKSPLGVVFDDADSKAVREVVVGFVDAVERDDNDAALKFSSRPRGLTAEAAQLDDMKEVIQAGLDPGEIRLITVGRGRALVVTEFAKLSDPMYKNRVCMVYTLVKHDGDWRIDDVDLEDVEGLAGEIRRFDAEFGLGPAPPAIKPAGPDADPSDRRALGTAQVTVTVTLDGRPVEGATVKLRPEKPGGQLVAGRTDATGTAVMASDDDGKGVIPGIYSVTISKIIIHEEGPDTEWRHLLPPKYAMPETSGLTVEVTEGSNEFHFHLSDTEEPADATPLVKEVRKAQVQPNVKPAGPDVGPSDRQALETAQVTVWVSFHARPVEGATVKLVPHRPGGQTSVARTDAVGTAEMALPDGGKSLVPGIYRVTAHVRVDRHRGARQARVARQKGLPARRRQTWGEHDPRLGHRRDAPQSVGRGPRAGQPAAENGKRRPLFRSGARAFAGRPGRVVEKGPVHSHL
ncbi:MAG: PEGA domain-containing protein [Planctomycetota bacterium]